MLSLCSNYIVYPEQKTKLSKLAVILDCARLQRALFLVQFMFHFMSINEHAISLLCTIYDLLYAYSFVTVAMEEPNPSHADRWEAFEE